ncbi:lipoyl synthase [Clostridium luticellarii]|jgi:lipoic acid synthetase|uniref:Lipoyl synthase n=1 Tax=Clostridium luticellarii TaxID=1691940 RepID=A0A2T0BE10_9CLOT|nr:lipoyl synthase [Clostridium luticellarii]MCI1944246.1 lipoyl synthase [Clostridium luticellarii]MCI1967742.1 lipoyl synthase [Clostridium luticellarii]MCI1994620.1 lipoyl synthase [Clostridium luticellarii]MCI2038883.1 lipoyl synthase [Clostridium luticellarii]PRR82057.1 Lipoyl synthase [Clostridium luticellarii]
MQIRKPDWLKVKIRGGEISGEVKDILKRYSLNTVCREANCPNRMECFSSRTATFMILGKNCTRNCTFCNVTKAGPEQVDESEPFNVAQAVDKLELKHAVITSVTRDDLEDGGASHFARVVGEIKKLKKNVTIEVLIPDFRGDKISLKKVVDARPDVINHNVETTPRLYKEVRPMAVYSRSLELLDRVKIMDSSILTKSGFMLGLGEKREDVIQVMEDLRTVNCDILTIGQYLAPSLKHHPVVEYVHPRIFEEYREIGLKLGFKYVASSPLVRSSYHAEEALKN